MMSLSKTPKGIFNSHYWAIGYSWLSKATADVSLQISRGDWILVPYKPHPHHRDHAFSHAKSQWTIHEPDEIAIYVAAANKEWSSDNCLWGLRLVSNHPEELGVTQRPDAAPLKIAKFVGGPNDEWHGYPIAHWLSPWDKPGRKVLVAWYADGFINRPSMSRIHRGKRCSL